MSKKSNKNIKNNNSDLNSKSSETEQSESVTTTAVLENEPTVESNNTNTESAIEENNIPVEENSDDKENKLSETSKEETVIENTASKPKKKYFFVVLLTIFTIALILVLSTIFALFNLSNTKILSGVLISNVDVSNLSKEDAKLKISNILTEKLSQKITLYYNDYSVDVFPEQFGVSFDIDSAIQSAYSKGRSNNVFKDNYEIVNLLLTNYNVTPSFSYNEDALDSLIAEMQANIPDRLIEPNYYIDGTNLIITHGENGIVINSEELKNSIIHYISNLTVDNSSIEIPVTDKIAEDIDIEKIYSEVHKDAQDAYYTTNPFVVYPHSEGIDFDITLEEAAALIDQEQESYTIPLKILQPTVTTNQIGTEAFPDLLATFTTKYSTYNTNRSTNIRLATEKINGIVIMPGETFSYNQTVGKRTAAAGFKSAAVYAGGQVTTGIGGGICQVSSTLYNAVLLANLEIVERQNHGFNPGYVKAGTDATVSWGGPDFKFKNTRNYPIKVVCSASKGIITFQLFGLKQETEYEVVIEATILNYISYKTIYQNTSTLPAGETKVLESGSSGCRTSTYKILKLNGEVVSRELLSNDTYNPHNRVIAVGTAPVVTTPVDTTTTNTTTE